MFGKQSTRMQLALWRTEVTSHIKTQVPQRRGVTVGIQQWHGETNNSHVQCQGLITSSRHLLGEQRPPGALLWRNTLLMAPLSPGSTVFLKGDILSRGHCCPVRGLLGITAWLRAACHMVSNYCPIKPVYKNIGMGRMTALLLPLK